MLEHGQRRNLARRVREQGVSGAGVNTGDRERAVARGAPPASISGSMIMSLVALTPATITTEGSKR